MPQPYSQACENNKVPILAELKWLFAETKLVLELGSGTGQHSVYFAPNLPHLQWHCSDISANHQGILNWHRFAPSANLRGPYQLDVNQSQWPLAQFDGAFSANTAHIMAWEEVALMFAGVGRGLTVGGRFCLYGPFNYHGRFSSESNAAFDAHLRQQSSHMGIRDIAAIAELAQQAQLHLQQDIPMPANNRLLVFER
ncbi:DUF938 domain-containing protein [Ferrimonas senticii]|uniref:DUF938 domain-containing protein n=1 Tax=Ferrimonas senticii TaxID=394566 RepID=UPI000487632D|nr:DUF938 domain-containing protein [Ferrimonas senticii]